MNAVCSSIWRTIENSSPFNELSLLTGQYIPGLSDKDEFKQVVQEASDKLLELVIRDLPDYPDNIIETSANVIEAIKQYRTMYPGISLLQARFKLIEQIRTTFPNPY